MGFDHQVLEIADTFEVIVELGDVVIGPLDQLLDGSHEQFAAGLDVGDDLVWVAPALGFWIVWGGLMLMSRKQPPLLLAFY